MVIFHHGAALLQVTANGFGGVQFGVGVGVRVGSDWLSPRIYPRGLRGVIFFGVEAHFLYDRD